MNILQFKMMRELRSIGRNIKAYAVVRGGAEYPNIVGLVTFSPWENGTMVDVEVKGLPPYTPALQGGQPVGPFGFHIHDHSECEPMSGTEPFSMAGGHYNPNNQPHGNHAGDFPVLFSNGGNTRMSFYTDRFRPEDVIGRTVMIHLNPDDYRTQPAGNSGPRIACGVIKKF